MLEVVRGVSHNAEAAAELESHIQQLGVEGMLYFGYPMLAGIDANLLIDALLLSEQHGIVAFHFATVGSEQALDELREAQGDIYFALSQKLLSERGLRRGRDLAVRPQVVSLSPVLRESVIDDDLVLINWDHLGEALGRFDPVTADQLWMIRAAVQRVSTMRGEVRRDQLKRTDSKGAIINEMGKEIANLDIWQNQGAIETPSGVQRIRGLAGSGKTVVLASKAAYLHTMNPEWRIAVTFHTRSLYQQFEELIRRFTYESISDEPDWEQLKVLHAWGGAREAGLYSEIARAVGMEPRDFTYARTIGGSDGAFGAICEELLQVIGDRQLDLFDAVLIDEGQDLPESFFRLAYRATKSPHRVVYAYDELQNLGSYQMAPPEELFGSDSEGNPRVRLENKEGQPRQDIMLPRCYRNTPWALATAHALGFGIYRPKGMVQYFDDLELWRVVGYSVEGGLGEGEQVKLTRSKSSYPEYFERLLGDGAGTLEHATFSSKLEQAGALAQGIARNLDEDELRHRDILVILPEARTARSDAAVIMRVLQEQGIASHLVGVTSSRDVLFVDDSIAITSIYRAKGNEAPMVYVLNAEYGVANFEMETRRNILFTAVTRSRAWVRIFGVGERMGELAAEMDEVAARGYALEFRVPTAQERTHMRAVNRDMTDAERRRAVQAQSGQLSIRDLAEAIEAGELAADHIPDDLRDRLLSALSGEHDNAEPTCD